MKALLADYHDLAPEVRHFEFVVPELERLDYQPGQFVSMKEILEGRPITRAYSIASPPNGNRFDLCLNRVPDGKLSPFLFRLQPGEAVEFTGPFGTFTLREPPADSVFVATGTGITPFRAMIPRALEAAPDRTFWLVFGVRHEASLLYRDEFEALAERFPNFRFWPTLSRPGEGWSGRSGHVQPHVFEAAGDRRDLDVYICGLKAMVDDMRQQLKAVGFDRRRLIYEKYD